MSNKVLLNFKRDVRSIDRYYKKLIVKTKKKQIIGNINEWLVDNYYVISEQSKYVESDYYQKEVKAIKENRKRQLYLLVYNCLKENGFNVDVNSLFNKLNVYQKDTGDYFSYFEINFIHLLIRIVLMTELNTLSKNLNRRLNDDDNVEKLFSLVSKRINEDDSVDLEDYIKITDNMLNRPYYIEQFNYKLKGMGQLSENAFVKLNELLIKNKISLKDLIKESHDEMAKDNFLMMNLFNSLKKISRYKIEYLYKNISYTEKVLINEQAKIYDQMYDNNKMDYRSKIIKIAKKNNIQEYECAVDIVNKANKDKKHIGWYLFNQKNYKNRTIIYILTIVILTLGVSGLLAWLMGTWLLLILLIPISGLVIEVVNQMLMHFVRASSLFKLKFEEGLPKEYSTMVVIPTLVKDKKKVIRMFENLEVYYLSNKIDNIYFTLLGDCSSESVKDVDADKEVIEAGLNKVNELNEKYGKKLFYFVYRNRFYSESEECYLGFERKRGGLLHFNKLLLNQLNKKQKEEYFNCNTFNGFNTPIKYVITLDADTKLVLNTALKLIGTMAHPINHPVLSLDKKRVISGYGIMQPRIAIDVEVTNKSQYSQLFAGLGGLDIYTTACFDLYQDVFNEGSFVGKGIYDLKVFDQVLANAFPNNLILSHDLLEGNYLRCGFINDVELFDDYPSSYLNDTMRHHRWNRGDWQIISWLKKKVKNIKGQVVENPISLLSKWKIFDNLRRSLVNGFLLLIVFCGFTIGKENPIYYVVLVLTIIATPIFFYLISKLLHRNRYDIFLKYYLNLIRGIFAVINKSFIVLAVLPYEAYLYADSIVRSIYRMFVSKKKLLNWITAEEIEKTSKNTLGSYIKGFKVNYIFAILLILSCLKFRQDNIIMASIIAFIWFFAPILMRVISKRIVVNKEHLGDEEKEEIKDIAVRTWRYFDDLLVEESNYLIPDNFQFNRDKKIDYKTSPTNVGFSLVSVVSAAELGIINNEKAVNLITHIIMSVEKLEKWNGHLYNWYDINSLKKLYPYFISSVDNGNFIASLYVVKGFLEKHDSSDIIYGVKKLIDEMDFTKLYNNDLDVFSIGYNDGEKNLLTYHYNNFASESRLTSFIAIAKGDVPYKHWFCLDKALTKYKYYKGVASWAGTSFEYFMPLIFMKTYEHTLLDETYYFAYYAQKEFIKQINPKLPWGISESAYNELDDSENYKYNAFGIPYLKLQDSKSYPIILSPYSSLMAIGIDDQEVYNNVNKFKALNMYDEYGFYEAYDNEDEVIIKNYYAHHQGMILASLTNYLENNVIQEYFHNDKSIESIEMLLKEKVQIKTYIDLNVAKYKRYQYTKENQENDVREYDKIKEIPEIGILSNGFYSMLINDRGVGFSKYKNLQINRYRGIPDEDYGMFFYIRNLSTNKLWSNTYAPLDVKTDKYKVVLASDRIKYVREDEGIVTSTEITVVKDHNAELRKITFQNNTSNDVILEVTSFGEVIMCRNEEDIAHRAFNDMTIYSEVDEDTSSLIFSRQSRTKENTNYYVINRLFLDKEESDLFEYETSRMNFIGRNKTVSNPEVIMEKKDLSKTIGASLEPIMSIRKKVKIKAKSKEKLYLLVGFGKSKEQVMEIVHTYNDEFSINKAFDMTTVLNNIRTGYANLTAHQKSLYSTMLKYIYQAVPFTDERIFNLRKNKLSQTNLWKFGISGDLPIILVEIDRLEDVGFIKELLQVYEFYKNKALYIDIVIINNEDENKEELVLNYINNLMYQINNLNYFENLPGGVYIIPSSNINDEEEILLNTIAMMYLNASNSKSLEEQIYTFGAKIPRIDKSVITDEITKLPMELPKDIKFYNGFGGFVGQGKEYLIDKINTPTPWVNVIANDNFGSIVSNNLGGFSYAYNSREFKLTSWSNDIVGDPSNESIFINSHEFKPSMIKHGFGYTIFSSSTEEYDIFIKVFIGHKDNIKFYEINVTSKLKEKQQLKLAFVLKMVLGVTEEMTNRYLLSNFDKKDNCLYIKNNYSVNFKDINVFLSSTLKIDSFDDKDINTKSIMVNVDLDAKETKTLSFILGCQKDDKLVDKYQNEETIKNEYEMVVDYWKNKLSIITINTPDKAFDYVINGWYLYQVYASRLLAKAGFYQVGGATGFRDQLQDVMGILYSDPEYARKQILDHAKHQFKEGDVLHWWHEQIMFGSRTKFSDDYLWLIYVTYEYLKITEDYSILDEEVCFAYGETLTKLESEKGINYNYTADKETLYNHLKLCISKALGQFGEHNLPLMGSGDWNDGMNKVGYKGKGESVFVGLFLYDILLKMSDISKKYNEEEFIQLCLDRRSSLKEAIDKNAWDGAWYLRAYFDNGDPLGSRNNQECQIDLLCQAWSILSEIPDDKKKEQLLKETENRLVDKKNKLIKLLTPGFNDSKNNPGYIKDYMVGIRENGGQYTHAALWYIMALLKEGKVNLAYEYYQMINPINRTLHATDVMKYKVEPYVIAADIYSNPGHEGRGGWTWYTGSANWAYKLGIEEIIGFKKTGNKLTINPKIDSKWDGFEIIYQYLDTTYLITVINSQHISSGIVDISIDDVKVVDNIINLINDGKKHKVIVNMKEGL